MRHRETSERACGAGQIHPSSGDGKTQHEAGLYKQMAEPVHRARHQPGENLLFEDSRKMVMPAFSGHDRDSGRRQ
jgi:hypothetical protein